MNYQVYANFGVSSNSYRNHNDKLVGTGQENSLLEVICCNTLCLILKYLESKDLEAK